MKVYVMSEVLCIVFYFAQILDFTSTRKLPYVENYRMYQTIIYCWEMFCCGKLDCFHFHELPANWRINGPLRK